MQVSNNQSPIIACCSSFSQDYPTVFTASIAAVTVGLVYLMENQAFSYLNSTSANLDNITCTHVSNITSSDFEFVDNFKYHEFSIRLLALASFAFAMVSGTYGCEKCEEDGI